MMKKLTAEQKEFAQILNWNNQPGSRDRQRRLLFVHSDENGTHITEFGGQTINGVAVVLSDEFVKQGKWSHTRFRLALAEGVCPVEVQQDFNTGRYFQEAATWAELWEQFVSVCPPVAEIDPDEFHTFIRLAFPSEAERLDETEKALKALNKAKQANKAINRADEALKAAREYADASQKLHYALNRLESAVQEVQELSARLQKAEAERIRNNPFADFFK